MAKHATKAQNISIRRNVLQLQKLCQFKNTYTKPTCCKWKTCSIKPKQCINSKHNANRNNPKQKNAAHPVHTTEVLQACWGALSGTARVRPDETVFVCVARQHKKVFGCRDIPILMITAIFKNEIYCRYCVNNTKMILSCKQSSADVKPCGS